MSLLVDMSVWSLALRRDRPQDVPAVDELVRALGGDDIAGAEVRNTRWRAGVQLGTVDALIAQLAIRRNHALLTADRDCEHAAPHIGFSIWRP